MIKRQNLKEAIDAISERDPATGHALDEMLDTGRIDVPSSPEISDEKDPFFFLFENQEVRINKFQYIHEGTVPIEQQLLVHYGERLKKEEILRTGEAVRYGDAAREIRWAGLRFLVLHEIDYAITRLQERREQERGRTDDSDRLSFLIRLREDPQEQGLTDGETDRNTLFRGVLEGSTLSSFMRFPICLPALMQLAEVNLEYFHVRFVLDLFTRGSRDNLFACTAEDRLLGMIYLTHKRLLFSKALEVRYIASTAGRPAGPTEDSPIQRRGVGTFLLAGTWLLWKDRFPDVRELVLDAEIGAWGFYESAGFERRGTAVYVLRHPKGYLLKSIVEMIAGSRNLPPAVIAEAMRTLGRQIKGLRKKARREQTKRKRAVFIETLRACLHSEANDEIAAFVVTRLLRYKDRIAEFGELLAFAKQHGSEKTKALTEHETPAAE